jgi:rhodanese-related sulfurtransferase
VACVRAKVIVMQAIVLVAIGTAAGLADSVRRPIKLGREAPPDLSTSSSDQQISGQTQTSLKTTPAPGASSLKPGDAGWTPTREGDLPKGQITLDAGKRLFDSGAKFVDARRKEEYEAGHIKGAIRINLKAFENGDPPLLATMARDEIVVVYCGGGDCDESEHVAEMISNSGYKKVYVIHDGFPGWKVMGWPSETGEGLQ